MRKELERVIKRKVRRNNLYSSIWQALTAGSTALLLTCPALLFCFLMPNLLSCLGLPTLLLSHFPMPALSSHPGLPTLSSSCSFVPALLFRFLVPALSSSIVLALLSPPLLASVSRSVLGSAPTWLTSSALKTFKQALSDEPLGCQSTSSSSLEPPCPFPILGPLAKKSNRKRFFDTVFINSRSLAANHAIKEVDLSFEKYGCFAQVKLNWSWQLELLDCKPIYIIKAIFLAAALFWDLLFAPCLRHTMKLASKLGLRTQIIASGLVKERIELV